MIPKRASLYLYDRAMGITRRKGMLLKVEQEDGKLSWGEIAPLPGMSHETLMQAQSELLLHLRELLLGKRQSSLPSVQFGIQMALKPWEKTAIPINALAKNASDIERIGQGKYPAVKLKVSHLTPKQAMKLVRNFPKKFPLRIDANRSWTLDQALELAERSPNIEYFEEPFENLEDYATFPYPIALDETIRLHPPSKYLSFPTLKALIIKPTLLGDVFPLHDMAKEKGIAFILSSSYESELGIGLIAQLATQLGINTTAMGLDTYHLFNEPLFDETVRFDQGNLHFPSKWTLKPGMSQIIAHECF